MKSIFFTEKKQEKNNLTEKKTREIIKEKQAKDISSASLMDYMDNHEKQVIMINQIYNGKFFKDRGFIIKELKAKLACYKQQDIKKDLHELANLITLDNVIYKLFDCQLKCYYCNCEVYILFEKVRENRQWTLDRVNNLDEHTDTNTIIACLKCNLQRRRKNSDKFKFTKHLETNQIKIKKLDIIDDK